MPEKAYRLEIKGRVQGVYYRLSMVEQARQQGIRGWVRNRLDGSVEALIAGEANALEQLITWSRRGPTQAQVTSVDIFPVTEPVAFDDFTQAETA